MRLNFREQGQGPTLIILHGLFGSLENWGFISQRLAERFRVISVDQRNHGSSPHDPEMNYSVLAADLLEFMEQQNLASTHLLGHSMGGKTAMHFAIRYPEKVDRLVVVDIAPRAYEPRHEEIFNALLALDLKRYQTRAQVEEALEPTIPELAVRRFLLKGLIRNAENRFQFRFNLPVLHQNYAELSAGPKLAGVFGEPALFVRGDQSDYIRDGDVAEIERFFPRMELATIPEAGHWVHAEKPEPFLKLVGNFLEEKPSFNSTTPQGA
ncbi:MAG: alpha/beta fold hydrolase [Verrucomicrobiota bacterium]